MSAKIQKFVAVTDEGQVMACIKSKPEETFQSRLEKLVREHFVSEEVQQDGAIEVGGDGELVYTFRIIDTDCTAADDDGEEMTDDFYVTEVVTLIPVHEY